jgi:putative ABC transport system permease protein
MANLAVANLLHRKTRTAAAALAVAVSVATVMLLVGMANGTLAAIASRLLSVGADVLFQPPDSSLILGVSSAVVPLRMADLIRQTPGVTAVTPVLNWHVSQLKGSPESVNLWAVDYPSFEALSGGFDLTEGRPLRDPGDLVVDTLMAEARSLRLGETLRLLDRDFRIVGITRPGSGGRIYARLDDIGEAIGNPGRASFFLVKGRAAREAGELTKALADRFPGYKVTAVAQVSKAIQDNAVGLTYFRRALTSVAVVISFLVVLLAMYTAIMERTREIGILRALGATQAYVLRAILQESALVCGTGVFVGIALAIAGRFALERLFPAQAVELSGDWALVAGLLGFAGGLLGSIYPALRAARLDPVQSLNES